MAFKISLVKSYASSIYLSGTKTFPQIMPSYVPPVKEYAATGVVNGVNDPADFTGYTVEQLDNALAAGFITQQEYDETMAIKYPPAEPTA